MRTVPLYKPIVCPIIIGRTHELTALSQRLDRAKSGEGQVVLLSGEAGIGKTRLVAEARTSAATQGFLLLQGSCFPTDLSCPYAPLLDLLRSLFIDHARAAAAADLQPFARELFPLLPEVFPLLPETAPPFPLPHDPEQEKRRLFAALTRFLMRQAEKQPLLLIVEDLHWSDDTSLEYLHHLARCCATHRLLLLLTYRSDEMRPPLRHWLAVLDRERLAQEVFLSPLLRSDVDALLRAIFDVQHPAPPEFLETLYTLTEGNPFFIEEILTSLIMNGEVMAMNGLWKYRPRREASLQETLLSRHTGIPRSIQDAVQQRTAHVSEEAKGILMFAAVAGHRFDFALLQQVTHYDEQRLFQLIKELIAAQLVVEVPGAEGEQFAFRHALTQQAIYAGMLVRESKQLHRALAEAMERLYAAALDSYLADLASHFYEAGAWDRALEYAQRAGEKAQTLYAQRAAIEHFTRAVDAARHLTIAPSSTLYRARGQAYETLGEFEQAHHDYEQALNTARAAHDDVAEWQSLIDLGCLWAGREYERAGAWFRHALELAQVIADPKLHAHSLNRLGNWLVNTGLAAEGVQAHEQALAIFQVQQDMQGMAETLDLLGVANAMYGDAARAVNWYGQAIELYRVQGDTKGLSSSLAIRSTLTSRGYSEPVVIVSWGPEQCEHDALEAVHLAHQMGWSAGEAFAEQCAGLVYASFGNFGQALVHAQQALRLATEIQHPQWMAAVHDTLGQIYVLLLEPALARHHLEAGLSLAQQLGSAWWVGNIVTYQALACILEGRLEQAEAILSALMPREQQPRNLAERRLLWAWGELALAQGKPEMALQTAEQLMISAPGVERTTGVRPIPHLLKLQGEALAALQRLDEAVRVLEEAKQYAREGLEMPLAWRIHRALGRLYRLLNHEEQARREYAAARVVIASLAETIDDPPLRNQFLHAALTSLPREKSRSPRRIEAEQFGGLTGREREVASMIAQGKSNRMIAEALVVSERTVESHVSNILCKLGFTSRTQIAAWAVEVALENTR